MIAHLPERPGQDPDFVVAFIVQFRVIISARQLLGRGSQPQQRFGYRAYDNQGQQCKHHKNGYGAQQNGPGHLMPGCGYFIHRRNYHQFQPVGEGGKGYLAPLPLRIIADQFTAVAFSAEEFRIKVQADFFQPRFRFQPGMVKNASCIVHQASKTGIIHPQRMHRGPHAVKQRIHTQHADQNVLFINWRYVGNRQQVTQKMGTIGSHPAGLAPPDGRKIPVGVPVRRIQFVGDQLGLLFKIRLPHFGIEKAVFRGANVRTDAKIIGDDTVRMVGDTAKHLPDFFTVFLHKRIQLFCLFGRPRGAIGPADFRKVKRHQ